MSVLTTVPTQVFNGAAAVPSEPIWRLSVAQYHEMIRNGILTEDDPVELLEGWLVTKMPKNPQRRLTTKLTQTAFERVIPAGWYVDTQEPITTDSSEPEPDVVVVRGEPRQYSDRHPGPQDLGALVEVSGASLYRDRGTKKRVFAENRIPVYWIINLVSKQVEVYTNPTGPGPAPDYRECRVYGITDQVPLTLDGREVGSIPVSELLP